MYRRVRREWPNGEVLMVNTVHDSIIFDIKIKSDILNIGQILRQEAEKTGDYLLDALDVDIKPLQVQVDIEYGKNWATMPSTI